MRNLPIVLLLAALVTGLVAWQVWRAPAASGAVDEVALVPGGASPRVAGMDDRRRDTADGARDALPLGRAQVEPPARPPSASPAPPWLAGVRSAAVRGRLVDGRSGAPVPGVELRLRASLAGLVTGDGPGWIKESLTSAADGGFESAGAFPAGTVVAEGRIDRKRVLFGDSAHSHIDGEPNGCEWILYTNSGPVYGLRVHNAGPVEPELWRARLVELGPDDKRRDWAWQPLRDEDGLLVRFPVVQYPPDPEFSPRLELQSLDGVWGGGAAVVTTEGTHPGVLDVEAVAVGALLLGRVVDADGQPLAGVPIDLEALARNDATPHDRTHTSTDEQGSFHFEGLPVGGYVVRASPDSYPPQTRVVQGSGVVAVPEFRVGSAAALARASARRAASQPGAPTLATLAEALSRFRPAAPEPPAAHAESDGGMSDLPTGPASGTPVDASAARDYVAAAAAGEAHRAPELATPPALAEPYAARSGAAERAVSAAPEGAPRAGALAPWLALVDTPSALVRGALVDSTGGPLGGVELVLRATLLLSTEHGTTSLVREESVRTDADGSFATRGAFPIGAVAVEARARDAQLELVAARFEHGTGGAALRLALAPRPALALSIENAPAGSAWRARVVEPVAAGARAGAWQDLGAARSATLAYPLERLAILAGAARVDVVSVDGRLSAAAELRAGAAWNEPLVLSIASLALTGRVLAEDGAPLSGVAVALEREEGEPRASEAARATTTDAQGVYRFDTLAVGGYRVRVLPAGGRSQECLVRARAGEQVLPDFVVALEPLDPAIARAPAQLPDAEIARAPAQEPRDSPTAHTPAQELAPAASVGAPAPALEIRGAMRCASGSGTPWVILRLSAGDDARYALVGQVPGETSFAFAGLDAREYELTVLPPYEGAFQPVSVRVRPPDDTLEFFMPSCADARTLIFRALDRASRAPVAHARVQIDTAHVWRARSATGPDARVELQSGARFTWSVVAQGYRPATGDERDFPRGADGELEVLLEPGWGGVFRFEQVDQPGSAPRVRERDGVAVEVHAQGELLGTSQRDGVLRLERAAPPAALEVRASGWRPVQTATPWWLSPHDAGSVRMQRE